MRLASSSRDRNWLGSSAEQLLFAESARFQCILLCIMCNIGKNTVKKNYIKFAPTVQEFNSELHENYRVFTDSVIYFRSSPWVGYYPQMESHTNSQSKMGVEFYPRRKPIEALVP